MLRLLEVRNLALIDNLSFYPGEGLNVITGETGAGKSMLLGAVNLLLGERANPDVIRSGEEAAFVQAVFTGLGDGFCDENVDSGEEELMLCREIRHGGPNLCRVNGSVRPLAQLGPLGRALIDLHGQNQQQSLLSSQTQRMLLDAYGGEELASCLSRVESIYKRCTQLRRELAELGGDDAALVRSADFLRFQLHEIDEASLTTEEEEELEKQFRKLTYARQLAEKTAKAYADLYEGAFDGAIIDRLGTVEKELAAAVAIDDSLGNVLGQLAAVSSQLTEAARELRTYHDEISLDESELQEVVLRLDIYKKIKKKYGPTLEDVETLAREMRTELAGLDGRGEHVAKLSIELAAAVTDLERNAAQLSIQRQKAASILVEKINTALQSLALSGAQFDIRMDESDAVSAHGKDKVEFLFSANVGEPLQLLSKVASGGEISRVMLAVKSVLAVEDHIPTLIFDEIDAGVGGTTVRSIAERLRHLARYRQVICVTHQPLIAAAANHHFTIYKITEDGRTVTRLTKLSQNDRETELTRMLGGEPHDQTALNHARQLLRGQV
ncbi:MAG: DNA repair protein RecN [Clostridiales bacterium]|jgi:DNA repair protein RecN (Recombination protein N)|nr:DNA repair protein RecN [Clostridiales bacterium]